MVALDGAGKALRPALLWMDMRSAPQVGAARGRRLEGVHHSRLAAVSLHAMPAVMYPPCLVRPPAQAAKVAACGDEALAVNSAGAGPVSAEWMVPKVRGGQGVACEALHARVPRTAAHALHRTVQPAW